MKKLIFSLILATSVILFSCNGPKEPPDDYLIQRINAHADSLKKIDVLNKQ